METRIAPKLTRANRIEGRKKIDLGIKMVAVTAGKFVCQGLHGVCHNGFKIAETELTNGQFRKLLALEPKESARIVNNPQKQLKRSLSSVDPDYKNEAEDCPMVSLSQEEFAGIAKLLGMRLPTELEWGKIAAGQSVFSKWGIDRNKATFNRKGTRSVYAHRNAATPEGVLDLFGNVWEWTSSNWDSIDSTDPLKPRLPQMPQNGKQKVLWGGSWYDDNPDHDNYWAYVIPTFRGCAPPWERHNNVGARFGENIG